MFFLDVASSTSDDEDNEFYDAQSTTSPTFVSPQIDDSFILKYQNRSCFIDRTGSSSETEGDELHKKSETNSTEVKQVNEPVNIVCFFLFSFITLLSLIFCVILFENKEWGIHKI